ncbi:hypothetical protein GWI33_000455, partial [Rhynchophorus ferrugineus]
KKNPEPLLRGGESSEEPRRSPTVKWTFSKGPLSDKYKEMIDPHIRGLPGIVKISNDFCPPGGLRSTFVTVEAAPLDKQPVGERGRVVRNRLKCFG